MKYVFTFNEINHGRIEIESVHKPGNAEIIEKILEGEGHYNETDFADFKLIEINRTSGDERYACCLHETPRTFDWCEENCERYYRCDTVAGALDELLDEETGDGLQKFAVTITETLQKIVTVVAGDSHDAEDAVRREWDNEEHVLGAEHFKGVEFAAVPVCEELA